MSRSFAIPIRLLPGQTADAVMLAYLVFRIADTIEDAAPDQQEQARLFAAFRRLLDGDEEAAKELAALAPPPYNVLMTRTREVAICFRDLPEGARRVIRDAFEEMCEGMQEWADREVVTYSDLHRYCYFVAGLVGTMLTGLFRVFGHVSGSRADAMAERAVDFGIALQMINIIRDVREDDREGRHYWPSRLLERHGLSWPHLFDHANWEQADAVVQDLVRDALIHCDAAMEYITFIPRHELGLRRFCAIPLYMAVATLRRCIGNPRLLYDDRPVKITRRRTRHILALIIMLSPGNRLLRSWYRRIRRFDPTLPATT